MMDTQNQSKASAHSSTFHEEQLPLFDAYLTDELDKDERAQVEQNVQECQECEHLFAEVTHLRSALVSLPETAHSSGPEHTNLHSPAMVHTILAHIEQGENKKNPLTVEHTRKARPSFRSPDEYGPARVARKRARSIAISIGVAACVIILLVGLISVLGNASSLGKRQSSVPAPMVWTTQQQPMQVQNSGGVFALKEIEITTAKELRFYYAFRSPHQGTIQATAVSVLNAGQKQQPITLSTTVFPLGTIDTISVGVIRVQYLDRVGQAITLSITSPEEGGMHWQLTPIKQRLAEPHPEGGGFYGFSVDQHLFPEVSWSGMYSTSGGRSMVAYFKNAAGTNYIFLEVDYAGKVAVITRERCVQIVDEQACPKSGK